MTDRRAVAVIGDGAFPSGIVFEALNNARGTPEKRARRSSTTTRCQSVRASARSDNISIGCGRIPSTPGFKEEVVKLLNQVPVLGDPAERFLAQIKEGVKAGLHGGMLFEELGLRYIGPIDGHDIALLRKYLRMVKDFNEPVLLHVVTEKGHGFKPAAEDPVFFHTPPTFKREARPRSADYQKKNTVPYTDDCSRRDSRRDGA